MTIRECGLCKGKKDSCIICHGTGFDTQWVEEPVCPHCGEEMLDAWELKMKDEQVKDMECETCLKPYQLTLGITYHYSSEKP